MFSKDYYDNENFIISSVFGEKRVYDNKPTQHGGGDCKNKLNKKTDIINNLDGVLEHVGDGTWSGKYIKIRHNFKYTNGPDFNFYSVYKHLSYIDNNALRARPIKAGTVIGKMGNTGYSKTWDNEIKCPDKWRLLTDTEKADPYCVRGVHLHLEFKIHTPILNNELIEAMRKAGVITITAYDYFLRNGFVYVNPECIYNYAKMLQGGKNV